MAAFIYRVVQKSEPRPRKIVMSVLS